MHRLWKHLRPGPKSDQTIKGIVQIDQAIIVTSIKDQKALIKARRDVTTLQLVRRCIRVRVRVVHIMTSCVRKLRWLREA